MGENEMVERVARAIWSDYWDGDPCSWEEMEPNARETALSMARAAIEAMRRPTEAMKLAVEKAEADLGIVHAAYEHIGWEEAWPVAIDAALKGITKDG